MENFSFKCSKMVKNALYLKKARTVTHECQKVNSGGYLLLLSNQSAREVLFTCLANTNKQDKKEQGRNANG